MSEAERRRRTIVIPAETAPPCSCGAAKVSVFLDAIEELIDNMGCDLGLEFVAGPFCPHCDADAIARARGRIHLQ